MKQFKNHKSIPLIIKNHLVCYLSISLFIFTLSCDTETDPLLNTFVKGEIDNLPFTFDGTHSSSHSSRSCCDTLFFTYRKEQYSLHGNIDNKEHEINMEFIFSNKDGNIQDKEGYLSKILRIQDYSYALKDPDYTLDFLHPNYFKNSGISFFLSDQSSANSIVTISYLKAQPTESYFRVTRISNYPSNGKYDPKYIIEGEYACTLYSSSSNQSDKKITNGKFKIPIGYQLVR